MILKLDFPQKEAYKKFDQIEIEFDPHSAFRFQIQYSHKKKGTKSDTITIDAFRNNGIPKRSSNK